MSNSFVISGLSDKRAELSGEIAATEKRLDQMRSDLRALDQVLRLYGATAPEAIPPKAVRERCQWFGNGELARRILETLRDAPEPMTAGDIARAVMAAKGLDAGDRAVLDRVTKLIHRSLRAQEARGLAETAGSEGKAMLWRVAA